MQAARLPEWTTKEVNKKRSNTRQSKRGADFEKQTFLQKNKKINKNKHHKTNSIADVSVGHLTVEFIFFSYLVRVKNLKSIGICNHMA